MAVKWTEEQEKVISLRNRSILVSAAAGSGKTAVLVQRILSKVTDRENPVDIDRLLIMTFTRAAAGEMRERISRTLEEALYSDPENEHLQRQTALIHTAQITTIDGFCAYVIRNYFHLIGLDPGYRTADEGELKLVREDVLRELLEDSYGQHDPAFEHFVECYAPGKSDDEIGALILKLYDSAMSNPWPLEWLDGCLESYRVETIDELKQSEWMKLLWNSVREDLEEAGKLAEEARNLCLVPGGPYLYEEALASDSLLISNAEALADAEDFDGLSALLSSPSFARLSGKKPKTEVDDRLKEQVKELREEVKGALKEIAARYFQGTLADVLESMKCCREPMETLVELTREFIRRFGEKKREKNLLDFTDMEHFALEILMTKNDDGSCTMSQAARELSEKYDEVMVDEYQDSNLVQEYITSCVSGWVNDRKNTFMVGDVKQSIYRFRLARPELFMEKYKSYSLEDSPEQRIDLHKNFRSRPQVLEGVNYFFRRVMGEDLGGVDYDDAAALYPGAVFPEGVPEETLAVELLLVERDGEELNETGSNEAVSETKELSGKKSQEMKASAEEKSRKSKEAVRKKEQEQTDFSGEDARELEALAVARRIKELVGNQMVLDKETGGYRPAEHGDIAVLLRTASGWAETFAEVFSSRGIPAYTASKTGYFSALEVVTMLNYLRVCDNPLQDIPLAGVLRSPIVGCTSDELALLRSRYPKGMLYESVLSFIQDNHEKKGNPDEKKLSETTLESERVTSDLVRGDGAGSDEEKRDPDKENRLYGKLQEFITLLDEFRDRAVYTPVHQLIDEILERTGYGNYAKALPDGARRSANLAMLGEKAMEYEKTSYRGLFNFVRYIEHLQKYEVDFGEVNLAGAGNGAVQIMTIHKSKGLEFPIVILAGMEKQFNFQDLNARLLIHPNLGLGVDAILPEKRIIAQTLVKQVIRREIQKESMGEELRVLYVALTRAKEKLIMAGTIGKLEKQMIYLSRFKDRGEELLPIGTRLKAKNYWAYVLPALADHPCMNELYKEYGIPGNRVSGNREKMISSGEAQGQTGNTENNTARPCTEPLFLVRKITVTELVENEVSDQADVQMKREQLLNWDASRVFDEKIRDTLAERFGFVYPFGYLAEIPVKVSVSELKKRSYPDDYEKEENQFFEPDIIPLIPRFVADKEEEAFTGAARGTAYHRVMECLEYRKTDTDADLQDQVTGLLAAKKMNEGEADCIRISDIRRFLDSPIGGRMKQAALAGVLFREQPFVISRTARELDPSWDTEEPVLVQGIIDAYFFEGQEIVLVDYKTDKVRPGEEEKLVQLYHVQLEDYAQALERMTGRRVKEKIIYSFTLGKEILLQ